MHGQTNQRWHWTLGAAVAVALLSLLLSWNDARGWLLLRNSMLLAAGATAIALPAGTVFAFLLLRTDLPGRHIFLTVWGVLLFVPLYLQAAGWEAGFGRQGWFSLSHGSMAQPWLDGWRATVWIHGLAAIPWVLLIVGLGLRLVEPELEEAALLDASAVTVMWRVTTRRSAPFLGAAAVWIVVATSTDMTVTDLYRVRTFAEEIYLDVPFVGAISTLEPLRPTAATQVTLLGCLVLAAVWLLTRLAPPEQLPTARSRVVFALGKTRRLWQMLLLAVLVVMVGVPLANLVYKAGLVAEQVGAARLRYWSWSHFLQVVGASPRDFFQEHLWTAVIGGATATAAVLTAAPSAWFARHGMRASLPLMLAAICLAIPGPMIGLGVIWLLNREASELLIWLYDRSILAPCLAMWVKCFPLTFLLLWYVMRTVPPELIEQAEIDGAGRFRRFWILGVTQHWLPLAGAWVTAWAIAVGDLAASILVIPPGISTIPVRVFGLLHAGADDLVAGICLTVVWAYVLAGLGLLALLRSARPLEPAARTPEV